MDDLNDVEREYQKNKELKKEDIKILQEWAQKQPHLPNISEFQLILFLHSCYYHLEPTKTCIEDFYTAKANYPEFFTDRNPRHCANDIFDTLLITPLQRTTPEGYQIIFIKFLNANPSQFNLQNFFKSMDMTLILNLHQIGTAPGHVMLADLKGVSFGHVTRVSPSCGMKYSFYSQETLPYRLKALYCFNTPSFMDKIMAIFKPYIKKELMETLKLFTDKMDDLYQLIPQECFPSDYGGKSESVQELVEQRKRIFMENEQFFVEDEKRVADESKRVGNPKHARAVFGIEGTFKKLAID